MNPQGDVFEACLVEGNRISKVGTTEEIKKLLNIKTEIIDLKGKTVLPGLIDAHMHLYLYGISLLNLNCKNPGITSVKELLGEIKKVVSEKAKGEVIRVFGFNELMVKEQRYPTIQELDELTTEHTIIITRTCGHIGVVNTAALQLAGINHDTIDPHGGTIEKDGYGRLTGRLIENAFLEFNQYVPYSEEELYNALEKAQEQLLSYGITSVHDAGGFDENSFRVMQQASQADQLKLRVYAMIGSLNNCETFTKNMIASGIVTNTGNDSFKIGPAKLFTDGSSTGPTIATREPYTSDSENYGYLQYSEDELYKIFSPAHKKGYQLTVHAQGDKAIEQYLNVIERLQELHPRQDHRHRVEHLGVCPPDLQQRVRDLGLIPVLNPPFPFEFGESYLRNYGGRTDYMYAAKQLIDLGVVVTAGSDAPITTANPFVGMFMAVERITKGGTPFGQVQRVTLLDVIRMYTINAAYASRDEKIKGSIEVGKLADLAILNKSILNCPTEELLDVEVEMTVLNGEFVYSKHSCEVNI
ncbi:amidohydrolase [Lysinibacillus yapensis]|uniref:amidohydrolase n=1 Tax=Ureibacillus yapensis TaxID=2304605 RepID=UPI001F22109F|nr:amidohydrolase [Lysinibacillus yapensis]